MASVCIWRTCQIGKAHINSTGPPQYKVLGTTSTSLKSVHNYPTLTLLRTEWSCRSAPAARCCPYQSPTPSRSCPGSRWLPCRPSHSRPQYAAGGCPCPKAPLRAPAVRLGQRVEPMVSHDTVMSHHGWVVVDERVATWWCTCSRGKGSEPACTCVAAWRRWLQTSTCELACSSAHLQQHPQKWQGRALAAVHGSCTPDHLQLC